MERKVIAIPADESERNKKFNSMFINSLKKFHPDIEVRFFPNPDPDDKDYWYRAKPIIACQLFDEGYTTAILMDNDQIITGSLEEILKDTEDYDVGVILNDPTWQIQVWDITHPKYYNNGLVVVRSKEFAEHWKRLCFSPHFHNYQYREQDLLTILCSDYSNYKVKLLDTPTKVYGEVAKPQWLQGQIINNKLMIGNTEVCIIHFGGGNTPDKGNYFLKFQPEVANWIDKLIK